MEYRLDEFLVNCTPEHDVMRVSDDARWVIVEIRYVWRVRLSQTVFYVFAEYNEKIILDRIKFSD